MPKRSSFVGAGDEPEEQSGVVVVERREADLVDEDEVCLEDGFDDAADGVVGEAAVEGLDEFGGGEVADPSAASTAVWPRATRRWLWPVPAGRTSQRFSRAAIHSRLAR
jgi:hypothetical protein